MNPVFTLLIVLGYAALLFGVSWFTSKGATNESYFTGNRSSSWLLVAFGMVGTSLSGVTFVSVPGTVQAAGFSYMMVVLGFFLGYIAVAFILLPLYYRLQLTSIYDYLNTRFGLIPYKTGALTFIISRTIGATARLYLVIRVLQVFVLDQLHVNFYVTAIALLLLILLYTFKGGVKTIVWTDTLQTTFMLAGLVACVLFLLNETEGGITSAWNYLSEKSYTHFLNVDALPKSFFLKQLVGGMFITISMTGLDQEMMQKNISVRTLKDSQKNMMTMATVLIGVNFLFLLLGGLLYRYVDFHHLSVVKDDLFPTVALNHMGPVMGIVFIIALISALFPSADGAITALTASFCLDILGMQRDETKTGEDRDKLRKKVHLAFVAVFMVCLLIFHWIDSKDTVNLVLDVAGYTYGPLLGLFAFGMLSKRELIDSKVVPFIVIVVPALCVALSRNSKEWLNGYEFGFEMLLLNGGLIFGLLYLFSTKKRDIKKEGL